MKWFNSIIDKIIFTISAICGLQIPGFIIQYSQRLGGHLAEAKINLAKYQTLANECCHGNIIELIMKYSNSSEQAFIHTGEIIQSLINRISYLQHSLDSINNSSLIGQIICLLFHLDIEIAKTTLESFEFSIPLTLNAVICALVVGLIVSFIYNIILLIIRSIIHVLFIRAFSAH